MRSWSNICIIQPVDVDVVLNYLLADLGIIEEFDKNKYEKTMKKGRKNCQSMIPHGNRKCALLKIARIRAVAATRGAPHQYSRGHSGAMQSPLFCRSESSSDRVFLKMRSNPMTFRAAWTQFPMERENEMAGLANGALCGQIFNHPVTRERNERGDQFDRNFQIKGYEIFLFCAKGKPRKMKKKL